MSEQKYIAGVINAMLDSDGFSLSQNEQGAYLLDEEGEPAIRLTDEFVAAIGEVASEHVPVILRTLYLAQIGNNERSFKSGKRAGRAEIVNTVHELLGIEKLQESLAVIETAMREHR